MRTGKRIGQSSRFDVSFPMFKSISLLLTGLVAAGILLAKPASNNSPIAKDPNDPRASSTEKSDVISLSTENKNPPPLDPKNMDTSVKPQDDFYLYANGNWVKNNPIPPEYSRWAAFNELDEKNKAALHEIAEKAAAAKDPKKSTLENADPKDVQKVGDFYSSG